MVKKNLKTSAKKTKKPWPTIEAMKQIYQKKLWGTNNSTFYSGGGSHKPELVDPYITVVIAFLKTVKEPITVCDLGCGDFNIGKQLVQYAKKYIAVDIVPDLITYNKEKFRNENLEFHCLDIAKEEIPIADCVILRQVLQHLSNLEIQLVIKKLTAFKYVILTEHIPKGDFIPNKDIISGQGTRLKKQSGVKLLMPPFNFKILKEELLSSIALTNGKGVIETVLYKMY